jgi:GAF domain-containing protein
MQDENNINEEERLIAVHQMALLDTEPEERFDDLTKEATEKLDIPISTITIMDKDHEWFKSCQGIDNRENPREISFCNQAMLSSVLFVVEDTLLDKRFSNNPMVINSPFVRFYAGIRLLDYKTGLPVGVFCVKDIKPRILSLEEINILIDLSSRAEIELNK